MATSSSCLRREATIFKKVEELTILCGVEACLIHYDTNDKFKIWPSDHEKVRKFAKEFTELPENTRGKRSVSAREILDNLPNKKQKSTIYDKESTFNPENYSSEQLKQALISLDQEIRSETQAKNLIDDSQIPTVNHQNQNQAIIPSQNLQISQDLSVILSSEPIYEEIMYSDLFRDEEEAPTLGFFENPNFNLDVCLARLSADEIGNQNFGFQNLAFEVDSNVDPIVEYLQQLNPQQILPVYQSGPVFTEPHVLWDLPPLMNQDLQPLNCNGAQYVGDYANFRVQNLNNVWCHPPIFGFY